MKHFSLAIVGLVTIALLSACGGGITKKTVNGKTTYYQDGKEISPEQVASGTSIFADEMARKQQNARYQEELKKAPRRTASEAVSIALLEPIIAPGPKVYRNKLNQYWRDPFRNQKKLPLVSRKKINKSMNSNRTTSVNRDWFTEAKSKGVPGDVYVQLFVKTEGVMAKNKNTNKVTLASALIYQAEIASPYLDEKIVVKETVLNIVKNVEQLNKLGARVRQTIKTELRPRLPSSQWIKERESASLKALFQQLADQGTNE